MKTLYIIAMGMKKLPPEQIKYLEKLNRHPRTSELEEELCADVLDEHFIAEHAPAWRRWFYRFLPLHFAQIIETLFIQHTYDVIFTQSERAGLPLAFCMKYLGIYTPHVMIISRITSMYERKSQQKMWLLRHTQSSISKILIWSSVQRSIAINQLGIPPEKIKLIKRGTDQQFWHPAYAEVTDTICAVGMEMRDYPTLVEALRPLSIPCHIAVGAARGEIFETVKRLYNISEMPRNITVGHKGYEELRALYARCRFVVVPLLPTDSDNGLTAILEAMAMGKTVICTRVEGQVDVIVEGETGIFVPQGDSVALRKAIMDLWNNPDKARRMGDAARKYVQQHHNLEDFNSAIKTQIREAAGVPEMMPRQAMEELKIGT